MATDVDTFPRLINLNPKGVVCEIADTGHSPCLFRSKLHVVVMEIASKAPLVVSGCKKITSSRDHITKDALSYVVIRNASHFKLM